MTHTFHHSLLHPGSENRICGLSQQIYLYHFAYTQVKENYCEYQKNYRKIGKFQAVCS